MQSPTEDRRRPPPITDSQLGELVERISDHQYFRQAIDTHLRDLRMELKMGDARMANIEHSIQANTAITIKTSEDTKEMKELLEMGRVLFKFAEGFGRFLRWVAGLVGAGGIIYAAIYAATHGGSKPPGP